MSALASVDSSKELLDRAQRVIPGGVNSGMRKLDPPIAVARAAGAWFWDAQDRRYFDFHGAFGATILGHGHPAVLDAVTEALRCHDLMGVGVSPLEVDLAEKLAEHVPSVEKAVLCNSGSEATYHAVRLARACTERQKIVKFQGCYHGFHDALAMNVITPRELLGTRHLLTSGATPELVERTLICDFNDLGQVEEAFTAHPEQIAAVILEPVPHNIGCVLPQPGFLEGLRLLTKRDGALLIFDEVITGFRHSIGGYQKVCGVTPDLTTMGKAMANGFPIAALGGAAQYIDRLSSRPGGDVFFSGTYNGHPACCAAALATIRELERPESHRRLFGLADRMRAGLSEIMRRHGVSAYAAGFGSVFLTYFMEGEPRNYTALLANDDALFVAYRRRLLDLGVFKLPIALKRNHTNLSQSETDIDFALEACDRAIGDVKGKFGY